LHCKTRSKQCPNAVQGIAAANSAGIKVADALLVAISPINVNVTVTELRLVGA